MRHTDRICKLIKYNKRLKKRIGKLTGSIYCVPILLYGLPGHKPVPVPFLCVSRAWNTGPFILGGASGFLARALAFLRLHLGLSGMGCTCSTPMCPCFLASQGPVGSSLGVWGAPLRQGPSKCVSLFGHGSVWPLVCASLVLFPPLGNYVHVDLMFQGAGKESVCLVGSGVRGPTGPHFPKGETLGLVIEVLPKCPSF